MKITLMIQPIVRDYLDTVILRPDMKMFEWGMGGSTGWFAERVHSVVSVEHDKAWFDLVPDAPNLTKLLVPGDKGPLGADPAVPEKYRSGDARWENLNFYKYATEIDNWRHFDFILVDGVARASCLVRACAHLRRGGFLVLDDSQREYYTRYTAHLFRDWDRFSFLQKGTETTIWQKTR